MSKKVIYIIVFLFSFLQGEKIFSQEKFITKLTVSGKSKEAYQEGRKLFNIGDLKNAIKSLDKAIDKEPTFIDAYFQKAIIYNYSGKFAEAEVAFEKAIAISKDYEPDAVFSLAETERLQGKSKEAIEHYQDFLLTKSRNQKGRTDAKKYIDNLSFSITAREHPVFFNPIPVDSAINTNLSEYFPCLTADGETMIFTRMERLDEDFFASKKIDGKWQKAIPLNNINTAQNEGAETISADGKTLVYTGCDRPNGIGSCDLYISEYNDGKWSAPKNMGVMVNSKYWDSQPALSADGKTLYFASKREGGLGNSDIWMTTRQEDGTWSVPKNLGAPINTPEDDNFPFIHWDDETLYYCSVGHPGMGSFDLFLSKKNQNGEWAKPTNLGYPINTEADEAGLIVSVDGKTAYFSSNVKDIKARTETIKRIDKPQLTNIDIYSFELYEAARPKPVTYVKGKVFDANTKVPLRAKAEIFDLATNKLVYSTVSDGKGVFLICLPAGKNYALNVNRKNYVFYSDNFELTEAASVKAPFLLEIPLVPIEKPSTTSPTTPVVGQTIVLKNIFFETGSAKLKIESTAELTRLKNLLDENPTMKIQINGHTDNVGKDADNMSLSSNRAKAVYDYLLEQKINTNRLTFKGFGENLPVSTNDIPEGRQLNRRTEFQIVGY
jgi:outer membrane protein OmpA-like peptidoglycan-associated protein/tetratricopeptide (TPR) repeat protein